MFDGRVRVDARDRVVPRETALEALVVEIDGLNGQASRAA